jgi:hypothetical protein
MVLAELFGHDHGGEIDVPALGGITDPLVGDVRLHGFDAG